MRTTLILPMIATIVLGMSFCSAAERLDPDKLPSIKELPDPFLFNDGSRVRMREDWAKRRAELRELVQAYEYGHLPPAAPVVATPALEYQPPVPKESKPAAQPAAPAPALPAGTKQEKLLLTITPPGSSKSVTFHLMLTIPAGDGPFPAIVRGDLCWGAIKPEIVAEVIGRGYILADFDRTEIVPDQKGPRDSGAYLVWPDGDFSATAAWAWGYHRVIDYLLTRKEMDAAKIVVTGHSRGGKTTILAGAMDDRIALTAPNNSGCGGAGCYRHQAPKSEDIAAILKNFPYWFQADFGQFIGKIDRLPIDQHSVKAIIAPRAFLSTEALGDLWANPEGSQVTHMAAKEVFAFMGVPEKIGIHFRPGGHEQGLYDWQTLLDFADRLFLGKPATRKFDDLAFPDAPKIWSWSAPGATIQMRGSLDNSRQQFERQKKGHVAFLGGSITEMNGYRPMVCEMLKKRFPDTEFTFTDAGLSSTCSTTGAFRLQRDVLSKGPVDLFFVEFAVNDDQDAHHSREACIRGMEGIIRQCLRHNPNMDIVNVHFINPEMLETLKAGQTPLTAGAHEEVAGHYGISTINLAKEVAKQVVAGELTWQQFGGTHPAPRGNAIAAGMIEQLLSQAWSKPAGADKAAHAVPAPLDPLSYANGRFIDPKQAVIASGWTIHAPEWKTIKGSTRGQFRDIPLLCAGQPGAELKLDFAGTAVGAFVVAGPDAGTVEARIDGGAPVEVDLYHHFSSGLHYPRTVMFATDLAAGKHTLVLRLLEKTRSSGTAARIVQLVAN